LVTEPTLSGIHDLERVNDVCRHFKVPTLVCINKYDINEGNSDTIESYCRNQGIGTVARIPYDNVVTEAMVKGIPVVEYSKNGLSHEIAVLWQKIANTLGK
jgi:MinD superfamily P-loop ATPase